MALTSWARCIPSAAIVLTTVGTPWAMLWLTFPLTPAKRIGDRDPGLIEYRSDVGDIAQCPDVLAGKQADRGRHVRTDNLKKDIRQLFDNPREDSFNEIDNRVDVGRMAESTDEDKIPPRARIQEVRCWGCR